MSSKLNWVRLGILALLLFGLAFQAHADVTVLLEEPYSYDGALAGTGHVAVYLSRVCADSPTHLRRCGPGERGVVVSRYARIAGYDWIAIPLVPYLYAVDKPEDVPLYADSKVVSFLRDQYRRSYLKDIAPDGPSGETPKGDWTQLIGSSYDRTSYGFQMESTPEQDDALIEWLNSRPNRASYRVVSRNCANFVRDIVNFYYPRAVSWGFITDLEITTPKHDAKSVVKYTRRHPDILFSRVVFPQVPGTQRRSKPIRGVLESVFRAKKYMIPFAMFHPLIAGGVASVYVVGDRFNPARDGMVFNLYGDPGQPVTNQERKTYLKNLEAVITSNGKNGADQDQAFWRQFQDKAHPQMDVSGHLTLQGPAGEEMVEMGITREDMGDHSAPPELERGLLEVRLKQQLAHGRAPKISEEDLHEDWRLLEELNSTGHEEVDVTGRRFKGDRNLIGNSD